MTGPWNLVVRGFGDRWGRCDQRDHSIASQVGKLLLQRSSSRAGTGRASGIQV